VHARIAFGGREVRVDLSQPMDLAVPLEFTGPQPRHFGAPVATSRPLQLEGFSGAVRQGASCNCDIITLIPHCHGTHTECVGHLTREAVHAYRVTPAGLIPALVVSVTPEPAAGALEGSDPAPQAHDRLITRRALERAWPRAPFEARALVIRTLPNPPQKRTRDYSGQTPPYLSREAAQLLVERAILHLIVDLPSVDREHDEGRLSAHRVLFGLPPAATELAAAARPDATITELAYVPEELADGAYLLELQVPALAGDAVPSRPLLYRLEEAGA
jgi:kynurenine formamidase